MLSGSGERLHVPSNPVVHLSHCCSYGCSTGSFCKCNTNSITSRCWRTILNDWDESLVVTLCKHRFALSLNPCSCAGRTWTCSHVRVEMFASIGSPLVSSQILCCWNLHRFELPTWKGHHLPWSEAGQRALGPRGTHQAHRLRHVQGNRVWAAVALSIML